MRQKPVGLGPIRSKLADIAQKYGNITFTGSPKGVYANLAALQAAFPTGTTGVYLVTGTDGTKEVDTLDITGAPITAGNITITLNGVAKTVAVTLGIAEVASLNIAAASTVASNVTVTLNGVATNVAVLATDTAIQVADKIRATAFTGWTTGGTVGTSTVTFTATTVGVKTDAIYSAGTTGATGTISTTVQGVDADTTTTVATKIRGTVYTGWATGGTGTSVTFTKNTIGTNTPMVFSAGITGVTATITLTTAGVASATSDWYYWDTAWIDGGVYQATGVIEDTNPKASNVLSAKKVSQLTNYARTKLELRGNLFVPEDNYNSWVTQNCFYDATTDKIVLLYNAATAHVSGGGTVKMRTIDRSTGSVSPSSIVAQVLDKRMTTTAVCHLVNGDYIAIVKQGYTDAVDHVEKFVIYKSINKGVNWTSADMSIAQINFDHGAYGLIQLANGRLISGSHYGSGDQKNYVLKSDDNGNTWSRVAITNHATYTEMIGECAFVQFPNGHILAFTRASLNASMYANVEPILKSISIDNGDTWSQWAVSTSITDCTADAPPAIIKHASEGMVELIWGSRYTWAGESTGRIYQTIATYEDAEADNFPKPTVIGNCLAVTVPSDFGYFGGCKDNYGGVHAFYYDLYQSTSGTTNIKYVYGLRNTQPLKQDIFDLGTDIEVVKKTVEILAVTGNKNLAVSDVGVLQKCTAAAILTMVAETVDIIFPVGAVIPIANYSSGDVVIAGAAGVIINSVGGNKKANGQYAEMALIRIVKDEWLLAGNLKA